MFQFEPKVGSIASHGKNELEETLRAETKKKQATRRIHPKKATHLIAIALRNFGQKPLDTCSELSGNAA